MRQTKVILSLWIIILLIVSISASAIEIMPLDEVEPGMQGRGRTVFRGTAVESFPIEIIDIVEDAGINRELILLKAGGEKIDELGGIAAGMSGSPVYVDNKLIGAIGYGWNNTGGNYALVTPIEDMLKLLGEDDTQSEEKKEDEEKDEEDEEKDEDQEKNIHSGFSEYRLKTPLMISGLEGRALDNLQEDLREMNFKVLPGSGLREDENQVQSPEPGSAVTVQLARGDVNVASLGTLTYISEDKILAFGHPFTHKGEVSYLLSEAYINSIIPSDAQPFKLGGPYHRVLGTVVNDRNAGIVAELDNYPGIIPLTVKVQEEGGEQNRTVTQLVKDESFLTSLAGNIVLQSIDETLDRIGKGTAWIDLTIMGNGLPDMEINKSNMYYSQQDIAASALTDLYQFLNLIALNPFREINIIEIEFEITVENRDMVALVQEARVLNETIKPGDLLELEVTLRPYRQQPKTRKVEVQLPPDINPGRTTVVVSGGFTGSYGQPGDQPYENGGEDLNQARIDGYQDLDSMLDDMLAEPENNDLIVQVYRGYPVAAVPAETEVDADQSESGEEQKEEREPEEIQDETAPIPEEQEPEPEIKTIMKTDYVLEGSLSLDIEIDNPEPDSGQNRGEDDEDTERNGEDDEDSEQNGEDDK